MVARDDRLQDDGPPDQRSHFERDRDRILYSSAFRRLAGVTQVVHAGEGQVFHNRLTHTLEVGQIARRLAQHLISEQPEIAATLGVDPEVAEAAAFAHDIGHPPFGHIGERALDEVMKHAADVPSDQEGFEANAQSFRIVTKLSVRRDDYLGLNLTRATLDAILKYPWQRRAEKGDKFGAYVSEGAEYRFARKLDPRGSLARSAEAEIMDWADDIAFAVHDLEDFYRAGLIPLNRILAMDSEFEHFMEHVCDRWPEANETTTRGEACTYFKRLIEGLLAPLELLEPYSGKLSQRAALREFTGVLINRYIQGIGSEEHGTKASEPAFRLASGGSKGRRVVVNPTAAGELAVLKRLTWEYVIYNPRLATQQAGQRMVIETLYRQLCRSAAGDCDLLSPAMKDLRERLSGNIPKERLACRIAADAICRLTDLEALKLFNRLNGHDAGSISDGLWI